MFAEEWPLMMFTLICQLAVGSYILLVLVRSILAQKDAPSAKRLTSFGFLAVGPLMALALIFSLFHLGTPTGAYRSILNLGSSWLSREILTAGGFFVLWFVSYKAYQKETVGNGLGWLTSLVGLLVIFSMVNIYGTSVRPAWDNANTYIAFFGTTFALGSLGAASFIAYGAKGSALSPEILTILKKVSLIGIVAVIIQLIYLPVFISGLGSGVAASIASAQLLSGSYLFPLVVYGVLSLVGVGLLYYGLGKATNTKSIPVNVVYLALIMVVVGEFIGRYVFYASAVSVMIGQS
ncbi:DMSO reductase [Desulfosporosinus fructosivorans]|uniref:DMSO reductase n=1 Tax=Desulfosporosinus fructosivorans TaxID=2018669 RepID=A0A4Z0RAN7_9FIRM|nr:DmsC/YnfH family molybdoenzyme membrane anchor subunit [Desulfosporosinus fructosivorans]TGE39339.1 DMSO reductase [Desulfosporosinus fructosivorans]